ncbi:N-6 DNA methylase [Lewinella cohaerens]|uniref:N-6 DNA methylase n=1 Tax=Lewinella cohaerens TaxID=70995 RepID=UPI00037B105E|nr:N-6 DNA methylase [Lewinella cohaerens]
MNNSKLEGSEIADETLSKVWSLLASLENGGYSRNSFPLVLLLVSLHKDDHLSYSPSLSNMSLGEYLSYCIERIPSVDAQHYQQIYEVLVAKVKQKSNGELSTALATVKSIDQESLRQHFPYIFEELLHQYSKAQGRIGGESLYPSELSRLLVALAKPVKKAKIYNPFAGQASYAVYLEAEQEYFGQEKNIETWALGLLRLMAHNRIEKTSYKCEDSILEWPDSQEKYDFVFSAPPFRVRLKHQYGEQIGDIRRIEEFLIAKTLPSLNSHGKLLALLPQGFLYSGGSRGKNLRAQLIDDDLLEMIISLPAGLLHNTGIRTAVLVLNKAKKAPGLFRFVQADEYVVSTGPQDKVLDNIALLTIIENDRESDNIRIISKGEIQDQDYNLNVSRYFVKEHSGVELEKILTSIKGERKNLPKKGKYVRIRDLSDDPLSFQLNVDNIEVSELKPHTAAITESCLLLAMRWNKLKPTYFRFNGTPIYFSNDIEVFKINESAVNPAFLVNELHTDEVLEQVAAYQSGTSAVVRLNRRDLFRIKVKLPSFGEQLAKVQGLRELSDRIKTLQAERNALAHGKAISQFNEFASLKHTLGRPRQNILDWSDNLIHFFTENGQKTEELNQAFLDFYQTSITAALKEIKSDINFISEVLEKGENGLVLNEHPLGLVSLNELNTIVRAQSTSGWKFKIFKSLIEGEKLKERGIEMNEVLFRALIDNILTNANKHGFKEKSDSNEVLIELTELDEVLTLEIKNNGQPFPSNFNRENFIQKYSTVHSTIGSGLGGYDIHRIAVYFQNPDWKLILEDPIFPVQFIFQFPIKPIK